MTAPVRRKQVTTQKEWLAALETIRAGGYPWARLDRLIDRTVEEVRRVRRGRRAAYAWSGGKDSLALGYVMGRAGITDCCMGITNLEYPAFLQWVTENMPPGLTVINTGQDLDWLAAHPEMLFPVNAAIAAKWFRLVQHTAQGRYYRNEKLDVLVLGRRRADGNYLGPAGRNIYTNSAGITRYSPMGDWAHEDVLALIVREGENWPPFYSWPRGFQAGTHPWAARQWCGSEDEGWREVAEIDAGIVREAARYFPGARRALDGHGA